MATHRDAAGGGGSASGGETALHLSDHTLCPPSYSAMIFSDHAEGTVYAPSDEV